MNRKLEGLIYNFCDVLSIANFTPMFLFTTMAELGIEFHFGAFVFCLCFEFSFIFCKFQFILPFSLFSFTTPILSLKQNVCYRKSMRKVCCTNNFYLGYKSVKVVQVLLSIQSAPCFIGQRCSE